MRSILLLWSMSEVSWSAFSVIVVVVIVSSAAVPPLKWPLFQANEDKQREQKKIKMRLMETSFGCFSPMPFRFRFFLCVMLLAVFQAHEPST